MGTQRNGGILVGVTSVALAVALAVSWVWRGPSAAAGVNDAPGHVGAVAAQASSAGDPSEDAAGRAASGPALGTGHTDDALRLPGSAPTDVLSAQDLRDLHAELASHPGGEAEFQRVVGHLRFQRHWEQFEAARRNGADSATLRTLAQTLDHDLPLRWQHGELTGPQAVQLKAQLLDVLLPDEAARQAALTQWREQQAASPRRASSIEATFQAEQERLLAAWHQLPPAQQQRSDLQAQLDALRVKTFPSATARISEGGQTP